MAWQVGTRSSGLTGATDIAVRPFREPTALKREGRRDVTWLRKAYGLMLVTLFAWMFALGPLLVLLVLLPQARDRLLLRVWQASIQLLE